MSTYQHRSVVLEPEKVDQKEADKSLMSGQQVPDSRIFRA